MNRKQAIAYRKRPEIAWSDLKWLNDSPKRFEYLKTDDSNERPPFIKKSTGFPIGTAVDILTLTPKLFDDALVVEPNNLPKIGSPQQQKFLDSYREGKKLLACYKGAYSIGKLTDEAIEAKAQVLWGSLSKIIEWENSIQGREVITPAQLEIAKICVDSLMTNPLSSSLITGEGFDIHEVQLPIIASIRKGIKAKGAVDIINVCHKRKLIEISDLKTTHESISLVWRPVRNFAYDGQLVYYSILALKYLAKKHGVKVRKYKVRLSNIFVQTNPLYEVICTELGPKRIGRIEEKLDLLLDRLEFHRKKGFEYPMEVLEGNGYLLIEDSDEY